MQKVTLGKTWPRVLVLDSGLGGMTIVAAIRRLGLPIDLTYIADHAAFPYGAKTPAELIERLDHLIATARAAQALDAVVIACNTASTVVLEQLRQRHPLPFVGVVPPVKTAGTQSQSRIIGLLATAGTLASPHLAGLIERHAGDCRVVSVASPELARMAERKLQGFDIDLEILAYVLRPCLAACEASLDSLVLGCTHYPLLAAELQRLFGDGVALYDPSRPVARRLAWVLSLPQRQVPYGGRQHQENLFITTGQMPPAPALQRFTKQLGFTAWQQAAGRPAKSPPSISVGATVAGGAHSASY